MHSAHEWTVLRKDRIAASFKWLFILFSPLHKKQRQSHRYLKKGSAKLFNLEVQWRGLKVPKRAVFQFCIRLGAITLGSKLLPAQLTSVHSSARIQNHSMGREVQSSVHHPASKESFAAGVLLFRAVKLVSREMLIQSGRGGDPSPAPAPTVRSLSSRKSVWRASCWRRRLARSSGRLDMLLTLELWRPPPLLCCRELLRERKKSSHSCRSCTGWMKALFTECF